MHNIAIIMKSKSHHEKSKAIKNLLDNFTFIVG